MAQAKQHSFITVAEYLEGERLSDIKYELIDGQVYAMAGASINHERNSSNINRIFGNHLEGDSCESLGSDMKVKVGENFYYPDVQVVCNEDEESEYYRIMPIIIVEVLSKTTDKFDKTFKKQEYIKIPSLQEYVLIEQDNVKVIVHRKKTGWVPIHYSLGDAITFEAIDLTVAIEEIYARVQNEDMRGNVL
jgi:Uma2 family endonuclease